MIGRVAEALGEIASDAESGNLADSLFQTSMFIYKKFNA